MEKSILGGPYSAMFADFLLSHWILTHIIHMVRSHQKNSRLSANSPDHTWEGKCEEVPHMLRNSHSTFSDIFNFFWYKNQSRAGEPRVQQVRFTLLVCHSLLCKPSFRAFVFLPLHLPQ